MKIRPGDLSDALRIVEMADRFLRTTSYGDITPWTQDSLSRLVLAVLQNGIILVAEHTRYEYVGPVRDQVLEPVPELVGMIALYPQFHPISGERFCDELVWWVEPEHRAGRAGYQLLRAAEDWALQNELNVLKMVAPAGAPEVGRFLEHRGYSPVESLYQKRLIPVGRSSTVMANPQGQGQEQAPQKSHVKDAMKKHAKPRDRFKTFVNGVLDQAVALIRNGAPDEDKLRAIEGLRSQLDEAYDDIEAKGKK